MTERTMATSTSTRQVSARPQPVGQPSHQGRSRRVPFRLRLTADVGAELDRYIPDLVAKLRRAFAQRRNEQDDEERDELVIVLSDVSQIPHIHLVLLIRLLSQALGPNVTITLAGASPMIARPLAAFDLPDNVVVADVRRRRRFT